MTAEFNANVENVAELRQIKLKKKNILMYNGGGKFVTTQAHRSLAPIIEGIETHRYIIELTNFLPTHSTESSVVKNIKNLWQF